MFDVITFASVASTQDLARAAVNAHHDGTMMPAGVNQLRGNTVIRADEQQSGRGRRARDWHSSKGGSYQTVLFAPPLVNKPALSLWVAVGVARALNQSNNASQDMNQDMNQDINQDINQSVHHVGTDITNAAVMVKWPNDLYVGTKKVAGILCEWCQGWLLVGIGVNVSNAVPESATRLERPLEQVHADVLTGVTAGVAQWQQGDALEPAFFRWDFLRGKNVTVKTGHNILTGVARGVNSNGCLQLDATFCCDGHVLAWSDAHESPI